MKFLLCFLMLYLSFALKGYFIYASLPDKCSSLLSPKTFRLREHIKDQRIKGLIEGLKAFILEVKERNGGTEQLNPYEHIDLDIPEDVIDIKRLFDFVRATGYATYGGNTMGKIVEDLTHNSLPDFSQQLGIKISDPENQILRNTTISNGAFLKELDFILFEKEVDLQPHEKKKVLVVETKIQLRTRGLPKFYLYMKNNSALILQYLSILTGEPFTPKNTSLYSMFTFIELYDKRFENFQTKTTAHELGMLLVKINTEEGNQLDIISNVNRGFKMYNFIIGTFDESLNLE